jgi:hypothetical protein
MSASLRWAVTFAALLGLAIPWFLWGSARVVWGLPIWLWWHIAWLGLAALLFHRFTTTAWGLWVTDGTESDRQAESRSTAGDRR